MLHGLDPLAFLALHTDDYAIVVAALNRAQKMTADRDKGMADYQSARTAGLTAQAITRWIAKAFRKR